MDGQDGMDGTACTVVNGNDGSVTISCDDGTSATISLASGFGDLVIIQALANNGSRDESSVTASYCALSSLLQNEGSLENDTLNGCEIIYKPTTNEWTLVAISDGEIVACAMACIPITSPPN